MKKIFTAAIFIGLAAGTTVFAAKPAECPFAKSKKCALCPEKMKGVETVARNTADGVEITMTAKDKELVAKVREMALVHYNSRETMEEHCPGRVPGAKVTVVNIENGAKAAITGATPEMIKKIQEASAKEHRTGAGPAVGIKKGPGKKTGKTPKYACPMGCAVSDKPGKCPKCGMPMTEKK